MDAEAAKRFDQLESKIESVGEALNRHIEQEAGTQVQVGSVGAALNKHIEQEAETQQMVRDLS